MQIVVIELGILAIQCSVGHVSLNDRVDKLYSLKIGKF